jgi:hypothetical protein
MVATLPHDSRDNLRSQEHQFATYGISWSTNLAHETELAQELAISRKQRITAGGTASPSLPVAHTTVAQSALAGT